MVSCECPDPPAIGRLMRALQQHPVGLLNGRQWRKLSPPSQRRLLRALAARLPAPELAEGAGIPPLVRCVLESSRSQFREDLLLLPLLLGLADAAGGNGTFVELGAFDGLTASNTLVLERCFSWRGVLIEANPASFAQLRASGRAAATVHSAVCAGGGTVRMTAKPHVKSHEVPVEVEAGAAAIAAPSGARGRAARGAARGGAAPPSAGKTVAVPCRSLTALLRAAGLRSGGATFLSLDVEGAEDRVLETAEPASFALVMAETARRRARALTGNRA